MRCLSPQFLSDILMKEALMQQGWQKQRLRMLQGTQWGAKGKKQIV